MYEIRVYLWLTFYREWLGFGLASTACVEHGRRWRRWICDEHFEGGVEYFRDSGDEDYL